MAENPAAVDGILREARQDLQQERLTRFLKAQGRRLLLLALVSVVCAVAYVGYGRWRNAQQEQRAAAYAAAKGSAEDLAAFAATHNGGYGVLALLQQGGADNALAVWRQGGPLAGAALIAYGYTRIGRDAEAEADALAALARLADSIDSPWRNHAIEILAARALARQAYDEADAWLTKAVSGMSLPEAVAARLQALQDMVSVQKKTL